MNSKEYLDQDVLDKAKLREDLVSLFKEDGLLLQKLYWCNEILKNVHIKGLELVHADEITAVPYLNAQLKKIQHQSSKTMKNPEYLEYDLHKISKIPSSLLEGTSSARILIGVADYLKAHPGTIVKPNAENEMKLKVINSFGHQIEQEKISVKILKAVLRDEAKLSIEQQKLIEQIDVKVNWGRYDAYRKLYAPYLNSMKKRLSESLNEGMQMSLIDSKGSSISMSQHQELKENSRQNLSTSKDGIELSTQQNVNEQIEKKRITTRGANKGVKQENDSLSSSEQSVVKTKSLKG